MRLSLYVFILLFLGALFSVIAPRQCRADRLRVVTVYTGAEAKLSDGRKIVYSGISVPSKKNKIFFRECLKAHKQLVEDASIIILTQPEARGKDLRRIPVVAFNGTLLINAELIRQGYALAGHNDDGFRYRDLFIQLQQEARQAGRGLWAYSDTFSEPYYVGSRADRKFHRPDCLKAKKLSLEERIVFRTKDDALSSGHIQDWFCTPLFRMPDKGIVSK